MFGDKPTRKRIRLAVKRADAQAQDQSFGLTRSAGATTISTGIILITALVVAAVIAAPAALGGTTRSDNHVTTSTPATAGSPCPCNVGLPGGPIAALPAARAETATVVSTSRCPCNVGLPDGARAARTPTGIHASFAAAAGAARIAACRPPYLPMQANCNAVRSFATASAGRIAPCRPPYLPMQANCNVVGSFAVTASTAADKNRTPGA
jgi:hypothetical protein